MAATRPDQLLVPAQDLRMLLEEAQGALDLLDELGRARHGRAADMKDAIESAIRRRAPLNMLRVRLKALLPTEEADEDEKTPVRPPSADAWQAFKRSGEFRGPR